MSAHICAVCIHWVLMLSQEASSPPFASIEQDTETEWYVGGKDNATETLPVDSLPVDEWEISPEQIIMDKQLGSGNFGEVFLGKLIGNIATPGVGPYSTNRCAAVKLLRSELEYMKDDGPRYLLLDLEHY